MKIGIFCDSFLPENKAVSVRMYHFAHAFHSAGEEVTVHTSTTQVSTFPFPVTRNVFSAPSANSSTLKRLLAEVVLGIELFFRILFSRYQLILISSPPFFTSFLGAVAARLRNIRYVFDVRDEYPEVYFVAGLLTRKSLFGRLLLAIENFIYQNSLFVITVTNGICYHIAEKVNGDKVHLVRNGFDDEMFKPSEKKAKEFTVVFHGNIGKFQNPDLIIRIAQLAIERKLAIKFKVIGWGNNDQTLKSMDLPNLMFLGMVEYKKIPESISEAHLGISFRSMDVISINSFPVKLYEYIGAGLPMIVTPLSEAGKFIEEMNLGFQFSGEDADEILNKIESLFNEPNKLEELSGFVMAVRSQFSRQEISKSFLQLIYNKI